MAAPPPAYDVGNADLASGVPAWLIGCILTGYALSAAPAALWHHLPPSTIAATVLLGGALVALSSIDAVSYRLPDTLTLPLIALGLAACAVLGWDDVPIRAAAAAFGYGTLYLVARVYLRARGRHGLGLGDAKLFAAAGAWLGFDGLPSVLLIASLTALAAAALAYARGMAVTAGTAIPFGPFLAYGFWLVWLYGPMTLGL
jgi:leader peptidase (prepilin peptidase) / N-methyltransferase